MVSRFTYIYMSYRNEKYKTEMMLIKRTLKKEEKFHLHLL